MNDNRYSDLILAECHREAVKHRKEMTESFTMNSRGWEKAGAAHLALISSIISFADSYKDTGSKVSPMERFSGLTRHIAILVGRMVIFLVKFITDRQLVFNNSILSALREICTHLDRLDKRIITNQDSYEREIDELRKEIDALKKVLKDNSCQ